MARNSDTSTGLGSWEGGDFETTVSRYGGIGADADVPAGTRFVAGVVRLLLQQRLELEAKGKSDDGDIAIFVLEPSPPDSIQDARRQPMLDNGRTRVIGRLWFTAASVVSGHYVELPQDTDDDVRFSYVDQLNLGSLPTLIFDPRTVTPQLRWYPEGLRQPDKFELKPFEGDVSPDDVFEAINRLYEQLFITPAGMPGGGNLWSKAGEHWAGKDAEALLQSYLKAGLIMGFPYCTVRHEQTQPAGRTDLELEQSNPSDRSVITRHAIIELKVLRSFRSTGLLVPDAQTKEWTKEGVIQAAAYRDEKGSRWSALCCFDMRKQDAGDNFCFDHVQELSSQLNVTLRRWFLYASSADFRQAKTAT